MIKPAVLTKTPDLAYLTSLSHSATLAKTTGALRKTSLTLVKTLLTLKKTSLLLRYTPITLTKAVVALMKILVALMKTATGRDEWTWKPRLREYGHCFVNFLIVRLPFLSTLKAARQLRFSKVSMNRSINK